MTALYLDTSVVLRAVLEHGLESAQEKKLESAALLLTSRLALVESARILARLRAERRLSEIALADAARSIDAVWSRCQIWELTRSVCETAAQVAPQRALRTLDALHLATFVLARRRIEDLELLTSDKRLEDAARVS
jgi:predicted nucleic acid-binding protein